MNTFIVSGPSGAGEDSIIEGLKKHLPIERIITTTTRGMRAGETDGTQYHFISKDDFERKIAAGCFAEYAKHYNGNYYGVTKEDLQRAGDSGIVSIWKIDYKGVIQAKKTFPQIPAIFITVPSLEILEKRICRRERVTEEYVRERMEYTQEWMKHVDIYDYVVVNKEGRLDEAIMEVAQIIRNHLSGQNEKFFQDNKTVRG